MSKKLRKTLGDANAPSTVALMRLSDTQSRATICTWCLDYARDELLPIFEKHCTDDPRPRMALNAAHDYLDGKVKFTVVKDIILNQCHATARELDSNPAAQAAARACGQGAAVVHTLSHALGMFFYGAAAAAYDRLGTDATDGEYSEVALVVCANMTAALQAISVENEPDPAKIKWHC